MSWPPKISPYSHFECVNGRSSSPRPDPSDGLPQAGLLAASSTRGGVPHQLGPCLGQAVARMSWPPKISPYSHFECVDGRSSSPRPDPSDGLPQAGLLAASSTRGGVPHQLGPCLGQAVARMSWPPKISPYSHFECVNGRSSSPRPDPSDGLPQAGLLAASSTRGGVPHQLGPCLGQAVSRMSWPPKISPYSHFECVNGRSSSPRPDPSDGLPQAGLLAVSSTRGGVPHQLGPCLGQAVGRMSWPPKISPYSHFECVNGLSSSPRPDPSDGLPQAGLLAASSTRGGVPHQLGPCLGQAVTRMSWPPKISPYSHFECVNGRSSSPRPDPSDGLPQAGLLAASSTRGGVPHQLGPCLGQAVGRMSWPPKISPYSHFECVNGRSSSPRPDPSDGLPQAGLLAASSTRGGVPHQLGPCLGQAVARMSWPPKISPYSHFECVNGRSSSPRPDPSDGLPQAGLLAASSTRGGVPHQLGPCLGQAVARMSWPPKISQYSHFECVNGRSSSPRPDPSDGLPQAGLLAASSTRGGVPHQLGPCLGQAVGSYRVATGTAEQLAKKYTTLI